MPEKSISIAAYAAGASVAAATLVYIFGPTFVLDRENGSKKRGAVGLRNYANDCFINSVLQSLAGLPALRIYLLREIQRRQSDGIEIYSIPVRKPSTSEEVGNRKERPDWQIVSLQQGEITAALKSILDELNERPTSKKIISAQGFILAIEHAFRTRVSRHQQDAQEFLQIVMQRLAEEYHAAVLVREQLQQVQQSDRSAVDSSNGLSSVSNETDADDEEDSEKPNPTADLLKPDGQRLSIPALDSTPDGLPFEGKISSQIECTVCQFKPKPSITTFVTLSLSVPHETTSTSLDSCLDGMLKAETIDGFRCDRCRLRNVYHDNARKLQQRGLTTSEKKKIEADQTLLDDAIKNDPENPSTELKLSDIVPGQRITKHMSLSRYPQILSIHLSRSLWTGYSSSAKNLAKVSFPEILQLGSLVDRHKYQLLSVVTHKGGHNSGHYETFRRQQLPTTPTNDNEETESPRSVTDESKRSLEQHNSEKKKKKSTDLRRNNRSNVDAVDSERKKKKGQDRWWRISDDKVKECKTNDVLAMQKEVYLLFYELVGH